MRPYRRARAYPTLVASLPHLARFDRLRSLPISRERLIERTAMLRPDDRAVIEAVFEFLAWQRQPASRTDGEVLSAFEALKASDRGGAVSALAGFRLTVRTVMAGLRRSVGGLAFPGPRAWGIAPWALHIHRHRDHRYFRLDGHFPWIVRARMLLEQGDSIALEHLLMGLVWDHVDAADLDRRFDFESVVAYLFRWDMAQRWLSHDEELARVRLEGEVTHLLAGSIGVAS
jgi:hypothetical protein